MKLQSMTGYSCLEKECATGTYKIEVKTVNNRYLDTQFRMPRLFNSLEQRLKKKLTERVVRGSVWFNITWSAPESDVEVTYDEKIVYEWIPYSEVSYHYLLTKDTQFIKIIKI